MPGKSGATFRGDQLVLTLIFLALACVEAPPPPPVDDGNALHTEVIARGPGCDNCTLTLTRLGSIGSEADMISLTEQTVLTLRTDGRFIAGPTKDGLAAIYDSLGAVGRVYGQLGEGPGEIGWIQNLFPWPGDSVILIERNQFNILGGPEGHGRTVHLKTVENNWDALVLFSDSLMILNYFRPPHHEFVARRLDGTISREMGRSWPAGKKGDTYAFKSAVGPAQTPHAFWAGKQRYRLELTLFDVRDGRVIRQLPYTAPWYTPYDSTALYTAMFGGGDALMPPLPYLRGVREAANSVLWTLYVVPAPDWAPSPGGPPPTGQILSRREVRDAILDLRDPVTGAPLLTVRMNLPLEGFINDSLLVDRHQTADGFWILDVYEAEFSRTGTPAKRP